MEAFANKFALYFVKEQIIKESQREMFRYGFEILVIELIKEMILLTIAFVLGKVMEMILFLFFLSTLRAYCGGSHAKTFSSCLLLTTSIGLAIIFSAIFLAGTVVGTGALLPSVLMLISCGLIFKYAPKEHPNQPITPENRIRLRKKARIVVIADTALVLGAVFAGVRADWILVVAITVFVVAVNAMHNQNGK